jgi:uncharacterized protein YjeT (DUF2065 family)
MDIIVAVVTAIITLGIISNVKIDKTSSQLMLLGLELTLVGAVLMIIAFISNSDNILYLVGVVLTVIGLIVNLFGFGKK